MDWEHWLLTRTDGCEKRGVKELDVCTLERDECFAMETKKTRREADVLVADSCGRDRYLLFSQNLWPLVALSAWCKLEWLAERMFEKRQQWISEQQLLMDLGLFGMTWISQWRLDAWRIGPQFIDYSFISLFKHFSFFCTVQRCVYVLSPTTLSDIKTWLTWGRHTLWNW